MFLYVYYCIEEGGRRVAGNIWFVVAGEPSSVSRTGRKLGIRIRWTSPSFTRWRCF